MISAPAVVIVFLCVVRPFADWLALIIFIGASATDWVDGYLARKWNQQSAFGTMLDPIADKAMVILAIVAIVGLYGLTPLITIPAILILVREIFVSGLREFLGKNANKLNVTKIAKWKTTVQMIAISVLFIHGIFDYNFGILTQGMDEAIVMQITNGLDINFSNLSLSYFSARYSYWIGVLLLWLAMILTILTGVNYLRKALPYLSGSKK